jgi:ElaB/YqjD/DUF883 family membrane-anchored ribosome-binding protein
MGTDAKPAQAKLSQLINKLPAKAPPYLQSDYKGFVTKANQLLSDLNELASAEEKAARDRGDYPAKKQALADLRKKINDAVTDQKSKVTELVKEIRPLNAAASGMLDTLKNKTSKEETALSTAIFQFVNSLQQLSGLEAPAPVD